jgi:putative peptide zinc metalloprotease protein
VRDPQGRRYFHLGEREGWILARLENQVTAEKLGADFRSAFGVELDPGWLESVLRELKRCGLTAGESGTQPERVARRIFSVLRLRLWGFRPQPFLDRLLPRVRFAFSRTALACGAVLLIAGLLAGCSALAELREDWKGLFQPGGWPWLYVGVSVVLTLHEIAHGLTCRHFGADVREMGFYLLYFQPCVATDVTDSWLLERRSERLWVILAPSVLQLWLLGAALLVWRILPSGTVERAALALGAISGLGILWNLNPLLPLDGYYALVDIFEIPNLRRRSFALLGRLVGLGSPAAPLRSAGEFRVALLYAVSAGAYSLGLLAFLLWGVARWFYTGFMEA